MQTSGCWLFCRHADPPAPLLIVALCALGCVAHAAEAPVEFPIATMRSHRPAGIEAVTSCPFEARVLTADIEPCD